MRNLKKFLAMVLALVMCLSLVTIANAVDFSDAADIDYDEAVAVMSTIGVIDGMGNNSFDPDGTLTREQAAKLITYMLLGKNAENLGVEKSSFKDVAATRWSAPAIEYCVTMGIIDGAGDGNFYPAGKLTGYAFAKVLLTALGYSSKTEGFTGANWAINVANVGLEVGLHNGLEKMFGSAEITRQEAAQMALNCIKAPLVEYATSATVTVNGEAVNFGSTKAQYVTTTLAREQRISDRRLTNASSTTPNYTVEFGEKYFPLLRLDPEQDDFERPSHTWVYENKELGTYIDYDLLVATYEEAVDYKTLYELLGRNNLEDYQFEAYTDGVDTTGRGVNAASILGRTTKDVPGTGRGVLTQVFVDHDWNNGEGRIIITSISTWLAKVTTAYSSNRESATVTVYTHVVRDAVDTTKIDTQEASKVVSSADVPNIAERTTEDEFVLVNMSGKDNVNPALVDTTTNGYSHTNMKVVKVSDVEIMSDVELTKFSKGSDSEILSNQVSALFKSVTADGKEYKSSKKAAHSDEALELYNDSRLTNKSYNIFLDPYGNALGVELFEGDSNYVFITGFDTAGSHISASNADAGAIFVDGTYKTIRINVKDTNENIKKIKDGKGATDGSQYFAELNAGNYGDLEATKVNRWFTYVVDENNIYTLTPATRMLTTAAHGASTAKASDTVKCNSVVFDSTNKSTEDTSNHPTNQNVRVYGNDNSVYLLADLGYVDHSGSNTVITGVDALFTGVQNVEINLEYRRAADSNKYILIDGTTSPAENQTALYDNTYTVYDKNNYVIASVVIGETKGSSANYAFIRSAAKSEERINGKYYWTFDAVVDGVEKELTVESKFSSTINQLIPGDVMELRYTGDYVTEIKKIAPTKFYDDYTTRIDADTHEIYDVGHNNITSGVPNSTYTSSLNSSGTTIGTGNWNAPVYATDMHMVGRTLYLKKNADADNDMGLTFVSENVPVFLIQTEDGEEVTYELNSVRSAISSMQDADEHTSGFQFRGRIVAGLNSQGVAKWAVIISDTEVVTAAAGRPNPSRRNMTINVTAIELSGASFNILGAGCNQLTYSGYEDGETVTVLQPIAGYRQISFPTVTFQRNGVANVTIQYIATP